MSLDSVFRNGLTADSTPGQKLKPLEQMLDVMQEAIGAVELRYSYGGSTLGKLQLIDDVVSNNGVSLMPDISGVKPYLKQVSEYTVKAMGEITQLGKLKITTERKGQDYVLKAYYVGKKLSDRTSDQVVATGIEVKFTKAGASSSYIIGYPSIAGSALFPYWLPKADYELLKPGYTPITHDSPLTTCLENLKRTL